jgi:hypothetical protein
VPTKIMLTEDNEQNRYLAPFLLEKHGYEVLATPDEPTGIDLTEKERLALMLGGRERALTAGCDRYPGRPINPNTFALHVESCLPSHAMEEAL